MTGVTGERELRGAVLSTEHGSFLGLGTIGGSRSDLNPFGKNQLFRFRFMVGWYYLIDFCMPSVSVLVQ